MAAPVTLPRRSKGPKPQFFRDPALDHLLAMVVALTAELSVAIERHDSLERLLDKQGVVKRKAIEAFRPDEAIEAERFKVRDDLIGRVFHILHEQAEIAQTMGKSARSEKLSYVADDRGAVLGGSDDPATLRINAAASNRPVPAGVKAAMKMKKKPAGKKAPAKKAAKPAKKVAKPARKAARPAAKKAAVKKPTARKAVAKTKKKTRR
jgi:hypothetical protein